jgi:hypothetical protein
MRRDFNNSSLEVLKLQAFLINFEGHSSVLLTGVFDQATFDAVSAFQVKYSNDVLEPWGYTGPTGYAYILTLKKINEIYCQRIFPLTQAQLDEIVAFRSILESLKGDEIRGIGGGEDKEIEEVGVVEPPQPSQRQNLRDLDLAGVLGTVYKSDWRYIIFPLLVALVVFVLLAMSPSKRNSIRASIKSWYLVSLARGKSILKGTKETPKKPAVIKEEPIKWNIKKEPIKLAEEIPKETEVIILGPEK